MPYHGAVPVAVGLRKIIAATPAGARRLMSARLMTELLQVEEGLPEPMANRLFSQVHMYRCSSPVASTMPPCCPTQAYAHPPRISVCVLGCIRFVMARRCTKNGR